MNGGIYQVVWVEVAVHAHMGPARGQVPHDTPWAGPEVGERILCIDAALNGMPLHNSTVSATWSTALLHKTWNYARLASLPADATTML